MLIHWSREHILRASELKTSLGAPAIHPFFHAASGYLLRSCWAPLGTLAKPLGIWTRERVPAHVPVEEADMIKTESQLPLHAIGIWMLSKYWGRRYQVSLGIEQIRPHRKGLNLGHKEAGRSLSWKFTRWQVGGRGGLPRRYYRLRLMGLFKGLQKLLGL